LKVLLVTSPNEACGIREHSELLKRYCPQVEHIITGPEVFTVAAGCDLVMIDHHAALHSQWTPEAVGILGLSMPVLVTQHDTFETVGIMSERGLPIFTGPVITHEKVSGYKNALFLRQGVLGLDRAPAEPLAFPNRVGTVGFDFPWKNFDLLAKVTKRLGLQCLIISPGMTKERVKELRAINPDTFVQTGFQPAEFVVSQLAECLATAFLYQCGNSGTSGAIRLGLSARRPVVAFQCRQFKDLAGEGAVKFAASEQDLIEFLGVLKVSQSLQEAYSLAAKIQADTDSWENRGRDYWGVYKTLVGGGR